MLACIQARTDGCLVIQGSHLVYSCVVCANICDIVAADKSIPPIANDPSFSNFFAPFEGYVHVAIDRLQIPLVDNAGVEFDRDGSSYDLAQKPTRVP